MISDDCRKVAGLLLAALLLGCEQGALVEIASGFQIQPNARSALADDGTVVAAEAGRFIVGNGSGSQFVDLSPHGLQVQGSVPARPMKIRSQGDLVFVANRPGARGCMASARGAYHLSLAGGPLTTLFENCLDNPAPVPVDTDIAMSPNGTVAFSQIVNGQGALYRGPASGPVEILRSGTGGFYNTGELDVTDSGRVAVQMEYFDGFAGGLMRGILAFDTPEQAKETIDTAIEKLSIGAQPPVAINVEGSVAFALNSAASIAIDGDVTVYEAGVYVATPTLFNTPKSLTLIAGLSGAYCRFGAVDINDAGSVVFEAALDDGVNCGPGLNPVFDGIFAGTSPVQNAIVRRGDTRLGSHQFFDTVRLGQINNASQVSFTTTYSEPLVEPVKVWRRDPQAPGRSGR